MSDSLSTSGSKEEVFAQFFEELERAENVSAVVHKYAAAHPHWAADFREEQGIGRLFTKAAPVPEEPFPERLPDFQIIREIARGGMGVVYEAEQLSLGRRVAVKVRRGRLSPGGRARFLREQRVLAHLHQTHIVPIHTAGQEGPWQYFAMKYIEGVALSHVVRHTLHQETSAHEGKTPTLAELADEVLKEQRVVENKEAAARAAHTTDLPGPTGADATGVPSVSQIKVTLSLDYYRSVARVMADTAEALQHAHGVKVLHRDVKPSNIMVDTTGQPWLIDFGLARWTNGHQGLMQPTASSIAEADPDITQGPMGTPEYMAPEQYDGHSDERSDVWGLGVTLYELLTLRRAFEGKTNEEIAVRIRSQDMTRLNDLADNVPPDLVAICRKATQKEPGERYPIAGAFAEDLGRWLRGEPTQARPGWMFHWLWLWSLRNQKLAAVSCLLLVVALLSASLSWAFYDAQRREKLATEKFILNADSHAKSKVWSLIELARNRLQIPIEGRRWDTQKILREIGKYRRQIVPDDTTERMDVEIRSLYARSLGVLDLMPVAEEDKLALPLSPFQSWPVAIHPDGDVLAIGLPGRPIYWPRGHKPEVPKDLSATKPRPRLVYSPDGNYLIFYPHEGGLQIWDREVTRIVRDLLPGKKENRVLDVGFDAAGKTLWACCADGRVPSWLLPDFGQGPLWPLRDKPAAARFNKDATLLGVADATGRVLLHDATGKLLNTLPAGGSLEVQSLAWSPDDQRVAIGTRDGTIHVWLRDGTMVQRLTALEIGIELLQYSPDGRWLIGGRGPEGTKIWDSATGELMLIGGTGLWGFARDGRRFAGGDHSKVGFHELAELQVMKRLGGHRHNIEHLGWSRNHRKLVTLDSAFEARIWDVARPAPLVHAFQAPRSDFFWVQQAAVALSDDGNQVAYASGGRDRAIALVRDVASGKELARWNLPGGYEMLAASGPNKFLSVREERRTGISTVETVVRELTVGQPLPERRILRAGEPGDEGNFLYAMLTPNGRYYWWIGPRVPAKERRVEVLEVATGRLLTRVPRGRKTPYPEPSAYLSPQGTHLWIGEADETSLHYDLTRTDRPEPVPYEIPSSVTPDLRWLWESFPEQGYPSRSALRPWSADRPWLLLGNSDFSSPHIGTHGISHDSRYLAWGSDSGTVTVADLPELKKQVDAFEDELKRK